jgi:hypothetical protein
MSDFEISHEESKKKGPEGWWEESLAAKPMGNRFWHTWDWLYCPVWLVVMLLWNWLMPDFWTEQVNYWHAWGLFILSSLPWDGNGGQPIMKRSASKTKNYMHQNTLIKWILLNKFIID